MPGDNIVASTVEQYMHNLLPPRSAVLTEMEQQASQRDIPIVGPAVARVLYQYAKLIRAKRVFELGSAIGYSTIWWAHAVGEGGEVHYTDGDRNKAAEARKYFEREGVQERITIHVGDALEVLSEQKEEFDIIFNDVDKEDYPRVLHLLPNRIRKGGLFITDNVLWSGRVTDANETDEDTQAIRDLNADLANDERVDIAMVPIADGLTLLRVR